MTDSRRAFLLALALFALAYCLLAMPAQAADAALSWTLPTTYEDGAPIADGDLRESVAEWIACDGTWPEAGSPTAAVYPFPATSATVPGLTVGTWCFRVGVVTAAGVSSEWSNVATKAVLPPPKPNPPTIVTIDIQTTATLEQAADGSLKLTVR